jgi:hypothetical protein
MSYKDLRAVTKPEEYFRGCITGAPDLEHLAKVLAELLDAPLAVWEDGTLTHIRARVAQVRNLVLHVYPLDHDPPHFHVVGPNTDAKFSLADGRCLGGRINGRSEELIRWFFNEGGRDKLLAGWARMHPDHPA